MFIVNGSLETISSDIYSKFCTSPLRSCRTMSKDQDLYQRPDKKCAKSTYKVEPQSPTLHKSLKDFLMSLSTSVGGELLVSCLLAHGIGKKKLQFETLGKKQ